MQDEIKGLNFIPRFKSKIELLTVSCINGIIKIRMPDPKIFLRDDILSLMILEKRILSLTRQKQSFQKMEKEPGFQLFLKPLK